MLADKTQDIAACIFFNAAIWKVFGKVETAKRECIRVEAVETTGKIVEKTVESVNTGSIFHSFQQKTAFEGWNSEKQA